MKCPNKNLSEYKQLEALYGEAMAHYYWDFYEGTIPQEILEAKESKPNDNVVYNNENKFSMNVSEYKRQVENHLIKEAQNIGALSKTKLDGQYYIKMSGTESFKRDFTEEQKEYYSKVNTNKLLSIPSGDVDKYILTKKSKKLTFVEVNPAYLEDSWQKVKTTNELMDKETAEGSVTPDTHNPFSSDYVASDRRHRLADAADIDTVANFEEKVVRLRRGLAMDVAVDHTLPKNNAGRYYPKGKDNKSTPLMAVNPELLTKDVAIHEFGHLFVQLLGGTSNSFVKRGRDLLKDSAIEKKVTELYPNLSGEALDQEILVTAIGFEGSKLFDLEKKSPFQTWTIIFFNKIRLALGLKGNVAMELAQQMLNNEINQAELTGEVGIAYENSLVMEAKPSSEEDSNMNTLITKIMDRIIILQKKYEKSENERFKKDIEKLLTTLETHRDAKGLIRYIDEVVHQTTNIQKRLDAILLSEEPTDGQTLKNIHTFLGAFDLLDDVRELYREVLREAKADDNAPLVRLLKMKEVKLKKASDQINNINADYAKAKKDFLIDTLVPHSNRMKGIWKKRLEKEFYLNEGGRKAAKSKYGNETESAKNEYINNKLAENSEEIDAQERDYIKKILASAPKDIGATEAWIVDPRNIDDQLIQGAIKLLDKADFDAMNLFLDERNTANEVWEEFNEFMGGESNQQKLYKGIIEEIDGKATNHLVGKYLSSFKDAERAFYAEWEGNPPKAMSIEFYTITKKQYLNPQWVEINKLKESHPKRKMYDYLINSSKAKDVLTPAAYSLNLNTDKNDTTYRLPSIEKNTMERLYEQGIFTAGKEKLRDIFIKDSSDIEFGEQAPKDEVNPNIKEVMVDEAGKENQRIPINYRGGLAKASLQSFDLIGISLMDYNSVVNYSEKSKVGHTIEILQEQVGERDVKVRKNGVFLLNKAGSSNSSYVTTKGIESNSYKVLHSIVQDRLYGISAVDMGEVLGVNVAKTANAVMGWTGHTMLMFNWAAGGVNLLQGKYQNWLEASSKEHYSRKDVSAAEAIYIKDSKDIIGDIGSKIPGSKTNLLAERFNAFADFSGLMEKFSDNNKGKRLLKSGTGHFINHMGEHYIQSTLMYSVMNNIKVKDSDGKLISLQDAYEVKEGKIALKPGIDIDSDFEFQVSRKIKEVIKQIHGNYDSNNQSMSQRYVAGKFAFMLRKWMVVGAQRRWRGISAAGKKDRTIDDVAFNSILESEMEGYYTTTARFLYTLRKELATLQFGMMSGEWNNLTDQERANIRKTIIDIATMISTLAAAMILAGLGEEADEEDKELYYAAAYMFRRHYSELRFFSSPEEGMNILRTPAASLSMIDRTGALVAQLFSPTERYQSGPRKGTLKLKRYAGQVVPVFGQLDRNLQDSYEWLSK